MFLYSVYFGALSVMLPFVGASFGLGPAAEGRLFPANFGGFVGGVLVCGYLSDRWGRKAVLLLGIAVYALGLALFGAAPTFALALLASDLGLDLLLGGFAAGLITREVLRGREVNVFDSKLTAVGFGFFIPFFFVFSGMNLAISALFTSPSGVVKLFVFLALFLVVRGVPALVLYRGVLGARDRAALAFFTSTQLPLVLAITTVATSTGHMRASTAAALVSAAVLSTLIYPLMGMRLRGDVAGLPPKVPEARAEVGEAPAGVAT